MCELLGMNANVPTDICFSFSGLLQRGGNTGPHRDGWGIVFYNDNGYQIFKESLSSCTSLLAKMLPTMSIKSKCIISHVRQANVGEVNLENTHPFVRELFGYHCSFAHNGQLKGYDKLLTGSFYPVGSTDSEFIFCHLLNKLKNNFKKMPEDYSLIARLLYNSLTSIEEFGVSNVLMSINSYTFAYCSNNLYWITRKHPFGQASLIDDDIEIDFQSETKTGDVVSIIATKPLTDNESWNKMTPGQMLVFFNGKIIYNLFRND